jgi:hypothetical protein
VHRGDLGAAISMWRAAAAAALDVRLGARLAAERREVELAKEALRRELAEARDALRTAAERRQEQAMRRMLNLGLARGFGAWAVMARRTRYAAALLLLAR